MATTKELSEASASSSKTAEAVWRNVNDVFEAMLECFDEVLQTMNYLLARTDGGQGFKANSIVSRSRTPWPGAVAWVRPWHDKTGFALRMGIIPDHGIRFTVLWVDLLPGKAGLATVRLDGRVVTLNLMELNKEDFKKDFVKVVQATTDTVLERYRQADEAVERALSRFDR
jgi:hypothetical protein